MVVLGEGLGEGGRGKEEERAGCRSQLVGSCNSVNGVFRMTCVRLKVPRPQRRRAPAADSTVSVPLGRCSESIAPLPYGSTDTQPLFP